MTSAADHKAPPPAVMLGLITGYWAARPSASSRSSASPTN